VRRRAEAKNCKIEFEFPGHAVYPPSGRPILIVVEEDYLTYRYRALVPGQPGHAEMVSLLAAGPSVVRGLKRRIVNLDDLESHWPGAALRGSL
jgi:hypothetical protein